MGASSSGYMAKLAHSLRAALMFKVGGRAGRAKQQAGAGAGAGGGEHVGAAASHRARDEEADEEVGEKEVVEILWEPEVELPAARRGAGREVTRVGQQVEAERGLAKQVGLQLQVGAPPGGEGRGGEGEA